MTAPGMPASIGKGFVVIVTRKGNDWADKVHGMVAIYSLKEVRDDAAAGVVLGKALMSDVLTKVGRLRRDAHDVTGTCVLHSTTSCLSTSDRG